MRDMVDEERRLKGRGKHWDSLTTPGMTPELEQACHVMSKGVLKAHLERKYGIGGWGHAPRWHDGGGDKNGVMLLTGQMLGTEAVECGQVEMRRQLAELDAIAVRGRGRDG